MSTASQPLMELLRNTPPPSMSGLHDSVRSIPPPPLCPPPLTILKIVPPPPLPSHLSRICPPSAMQMTANQMATNSSYTSTHSQRTKKVESFHQDAARMQNKKGSGKIGRLNHSNNRDCRSRDNSHGNAARSRDVMLGQADRSRDVTQGQADRSRDVTHGQADRSRDTADGAGGWSRDCEISAEDAELVNVLKHLVNLFTMTSQVKAALSRVKPKPDDSGIQHQVSRTRALVESFREQLARRTVTLGRLIPPETTGKPEIPRELRTKDPAGGDVSPQPDTAAASPTSSPASQGLQGQDESPGGRTVTTQAAISSLQALVSGDAGADPLGGASRWASRVKRRFLAASRPVRRVTERLKAPHSSGRWHDGTSSASPGATVSTGSTAADSTPSPAAVRRSPRPSSASSCCSSSDGDAQTGSYFSPGCYVIDRAGRPVCADADATTTTSTATGKTEATTAAGKATGEAKTTAASAAGKETGKETTKETAAAATPPTVGPAAAASVFGVPLSVLMAEVARKKKKQQTSTDQTDANGSPRSAAATASTGAGTAEQSRRDRSWLTSSASAPPPPSRGEEDVELRAALEGLRRLRAGDDATPSAPAVADAAVEDVEPETSPRGTTATTSAAAATASRAGDVDTPPAATASTNAEGEDWMGMTTSFEEDWFLITEREEEEQRRKEEEEKEARRKRERRDGEKDGEEE